MHFTSLIASLIIAHVAAAPAPVDWKTVDYSGVDWSKVDYSGVDWSKVDYSNVDWSKVDYSGVDWSKVNYANVDWSKVNYNQATKPTGTQTATTTVSSASATATASAAPRGPYGLITIRSGSDLQNSAIYFNQTLRVGGTPPKSYTPPNINVPTTTSLAVYVGDNAMSLAVVVPGGQKNYVNADGTIGATIPHSGALPSGAVDAGFSLTPGSSSSSFSTLNYNGKRQFVACPVTGVAGEYEIVVSEKTKRTDCTGIDVAGVYSANYQPAWQWS